MDISATRVLVMLDEQPHVARGHVSVDFCPADSLAQKNGQSARVVVMDFRRRSGRRDITYLRVSLPNHSNAYTHREAALTRG
eukprot:2111406-Prymnesium_polylepis.1